MNHYRRWLSSLPFFFPTYLLRFEVAGIPTTFLEILVGVTALIGVLGFLRFKSLKKWFQRQREHWLSKPIWPVLLFFFAATISMIIVPDSMLDINGDSVGTARIAEGIWKGWIFMPIVYFLMISGIEKDKNWWRNSFNMLMVSGFGLALWAIYQMVTGYYLTWDDRASGPFESANYLALYLAPILLFVVVKFLNLVKSAKPLYPFLWGGVLIVMSVALWGTQSYASFLALGVGLAFYVLVHPSVSQKRKGRLVLLAFVSALLLLFTQFNTAKFEQFLDFSERSSSSVRIEVYTIASTLLLENPLFGIGLGQFELQYQLNAPRILEHAPYEWVMPHPHNLFFAFWLNTGFLGVLAITWLILLAFIKSFPHESHGFFRRLLAKLESWMNGGVGDSYQLIALSMLVVILTHGLFDTPFWKNDLAYLWWWVFAILI